MQIKMRYSIEPRDQILVGGYGFLSFAKNISKNIDKNINKNLRDHWSQKLFDNAKKSDTNALKTTAKRGIQKKQKKNKAEGTRDLVKDKISDEITQSAPTIEKDVEFYAKRSIETPKEIHKLPEKWNWINQYKYNATTRPSKFRETLG